MRKIAATAAVSKKKMCTLNSDEDRPNQLALSRLQFGGGSATNVERAEQAAGE